MKQLSRLGISSGNLLSGSSRMVLKRPTKGGSTHVRPATTNKRCYTASLKNPGMVHYDLQNYTSMKKDKIIY